MGEQVIDLVCILIVVLHKHCKNIWKQLTYICEIICYSLHKLIHLISICMESRESRESTTVWSNVVGCLCACLISVLGSVACCYDAGRRAVFFVAGRLIGNSYDRHFNGFNVGEYIYPFWGLGCGMVRPHKDAIWDIGENVDRCD